MKATEIRRGNVIRFNGQPCRVLDFTHRTPGNLRAFVQVRMREITSGKTFDHRFSASDFVDEVRIELREFQVLYRDATGVHVMDTRTFEQTVLDDEVVGDQGPWLEPGMTFEVQMLEGRPIGVELPTAVELEVAETAPVMRTATKTASTKPAVLSNGVTIQVPEFISTGDRVRVNPREGAYLERVR